MDRIVVVGGSLAGLRAVEALRRKGFGGSITLVGEETRTPYDRPPLSKEVLRGEWAPDRVELRRKGYQDLDVVLELGRPAVRLDASSRSIELAGGARVAYDGLVLACGARPRRLPNQPDIKGVFLLRTLDDALAMRTALAERPRVVVVGAGFIGSEVAASCANLGLAVTVLEALAVPLEHSLGARLGEVLASLHRKNGVDLRCGAVVRAIEGDGRVERVVLADGSVVPCEFVCVGIGVAPCTGWLEGSGVELGDGVSCDATCAASLPNVVAAGDVANWYNPLFGERMRVEHWTNAGDQARHAVDTLLASPGEAKPFESVPIFWSDQYQTNIQGVGRPKAGDDMVICHGDVESGTFTALYGRGGRLVGAVTFQQPTRAFQYRKLIAERAPWEDVVRAAQS